MHSTKCLICNSSDIGEIIPSARDHITGDVFQILGCQSCGVSFTHPVPNDMGPYYPSNYRDYGLFVLSVLRIFYRLRVRKWMKLISEPGVALEIGCGPGLMLEALHQKGWDVIGVERTKEMAAYARDTLGLHVISGGIESVEKEPRFDLIILFNVLEHMSDPLWVLKECAVRLRPAGLLIISVPNFDSWQSHFGGSLWLHLDPPRHIVHFTQKSLANVLSLANLRMHNVTFSSFEHDPFGWFQSAVNKLTVRHNALTRYLMGLEGLNMHVLISIILGPLMFLPAVFLAMISWMRGRGALMQVIAVTRT